MNSMQRSLETIYVGAGIAAGIFLVLIGLLVMAQIVGRMMGFMIPSAPEFAGYSLAATTFLGLAYSFRRGAHIRVTLFVDRASSSVKWILHIVALSIAVVMMASMAYRAVMMVWESWQFGEMSTGIVEIPVWIPQLSMALGMSLFAVALFENLVRVISGCNATYESAESGTGG